MIPVTQPFLPPQEEYNLMIRDLWKSKLITNNGILVKTLEEQLKNLLNVNNISFVTNGTMALQLALKTLNITGEVITTPFSFVATTTSIIWENCTPVFVDIEPTTFCIDPDKIEQAITENTQAIMATHVYGIPCDVERIEEIAKKYNLHVIYDGAHAFGVKYKGKSIFNYGDISIYSFHATKVFHTVEGGGITCNSDSETLKKVTLLRSYGYDLNGYYYAGINAKSTEFHAAMGLCNVKYIDSNLEKRQKISEIYNLMLRKSIQALRIPKNVIYNYAYYPIILENEEILLKVIKGLQKNDIDSRRYFYPSLNKLPYIKVKYNCPVSESIVSRMLCLPLYSDLEDERVIKISNIINEVLSQ